MSKASFFLKVNDKNLNVTHLQGHETLNQGFYYSITVESSENLQSDNLLANANVIFVNKKNHTNKRRPLSQTDPTPLYFRLYSRLKQNILDGTLKHGSQLPTEKELSQVHNISRVTAIRELNELAADGLVSRQRAKGTHDTHN